MRILFITNTTKTMSGASKVIRFVAGEMAKEGNDISILSIIDSEVLNRVEDCKSYALGCDASNKGIWRLPALLKIRKYVKFNNPDCVCVFVSDACFMSRMATLGLDCKLLSCDRGDPQSDGPLWSKLSGWAYRNSDACVFQLKEVQDYFGANKLKRSYVIPNPFVPTETRIIDFEERKKTIVSVGRFTEQKGFDILIKAYKEVNTKHPDYKLVIYGDGPLMEQHKTQIFELGLEDFVQLPGFCSNVSETIKDAGIFCLSSRYEGIPNALLEAMSLGIPVVATDCSPGGARLLTDGGQRGLLVPTDDVNKLAAALCMLIDDKELAKDIGKKVQGVRTLFSPANIALKWKEVFEYCQNSLIESDK